MISQTNKNVCGQTLVNDMTLWCPKVFVFLLFLFVRLLFMISRLS